MMILPVVWSYGSVWQAPNRNYAVVRATCDSAPFFRGAAPRCRLYHILGERLTASGSEPVDQDLLELVHVAAQIDDSLVAAPVVVYAMFIIENVHVWTDIRDRRFRAFSLQLVVNEQGHYSPYETSVQFLRRV